jgi:hypothetical protein
VAPLGSRAQPFGLPRTSSGKSRLSDATRSETFRWAGMEAWVFSRIRDTAPVSRLSSWHARATGDPGGAWDHDRGVRRRGGHRVSRRRRGQCTEPGDGKAGVARCVSDDPASRYLAPSIPGWIESALPSRAIPADVCGVGERSSPERRRVCAHWPRSLRSRDSAASQGYRRSCGSRTG